MAAKQDAPFASVRDLQGCRIATEAVGMTRRFLAEHGVAAEIEFSWGATEVKPPILADAIVDVSETGSSLRANNLKVLHVVLESTPRFIANHDALADDWKRAKIERVLMLLKGAIAAATRVLLAMNAPCGKVDDILRILPALATPTVSTLADPDWGRSQHRGRGEARARADPAALCGGRPRHHRGADQQDHRLTEGLTRWLPSGSW